MNQIDNKILNQQSNMSFSNNNNSNSNLKEFNINSI